MSFLWSIQCRVFLIFALFLVVILLFKTAPNCSAEVLPSVSEHKKAVRCLGEKRYVLDNLHSGMKYSAVGHEFNVNESTVYIK